MALSPRVSCGGDALGCSLDCTSGYDMEMWFNLTCWQNSQQCIRSKCIHLCLSCLDAEGVGLCTKLQRCFSPFIVNAVYL